MQPMVLVNTSCSSITVSVSIGSRHCSEPALSGRFCVVHYHRPGYGGAGPLIGPLTFEREAVTFRAFMRAIYVARAHIVGHSASGCMVL